MRALITCIGLSTMMIGFALLAANGIIEKRVFDVAFFGLIGASVVASSAAACRRARGA
jgi:hypothetical protein